MIRTVTLYTVNEKRVREFSGGHIAFHRVDNWGPIRYIPGGNGPDAMLVTTEQAPIHRIQEDGSDFYIALQPELREILEAPIRAAVSEEIARLKVESKYALADMAELTRRNACLRDELADNRRRFSFNAMPVYKKLWHILKGGKV